MTRLHRDFVKVWETSTSIAEVSVRMVRLGYWEFSPDFVRRYAKILREHGVILKRIRRSQLPDYVELAVPSQYFDWLQRVVQALAEVHNSKIIHLDLAPSSVRIHEDDGEVKVIDWGLSRAWE